ncbi:ABC transporter ATP-binding protein [Halobacteriales archaeon QS_1_68_17]|nr:MAG: ABC transporter ATP-binding protein [Halobacteriales archaeon QS_1_68_17]
MIELRNIRKEFGDLVAVEDLSFEIDSGELVTLVGPSGSGKSTVLNMIAGHLEPTSGSVLLDGQDITDLRPQERPTSMVFQSWALFPHMTVRENIEFPIEAQGRTIDDEVEQLLEQVQLNPAEYAEKKGDELSGGEKQRVALARAIAYDPDILLLDEPLGSLDYVLQKQLRRELSDLNEKLEMTFIYVTHSLESALIMSDRIFILDHGSLVQAGRPIDIYREPENRFVAEFMGDANIFSLDSTSRKNGTLEVTGPAFESPLTLAGSRDVTPDYIVVRYDDAFVARDLQKDIGVKATVYNKLVKGNRTLVETVGTNTEDEYIAEIDYETAEDLDSGDSVYLQWDENQSILVPE